MIMKLDGVIQYEPEAQYFKHYSLFFIFCLLDKFFR